MVCTPSLSDISHKMSHLGEHQPENILDVRNENGKIKRPETCDLSISLQNIELIGFSIDLMSVN